LQIEQLKAEPSRNEAEKAEIQIKLETEITEAQLKLEAERAEAIKLEA